MSKKEQESVKKILKEIESKIQWLQQKSAEIVQSKEVKRKIQQLTKHRDNIEKELHKTKSSLEERVSLARPHMLKAGTELRKAFLSLVSEQKPSATKKVATKKRKSKTFSPASSKKKSTASRKKKSTSSRKTTSTKQD